MTCGLVGVGGGGDLIYDVDQLRNVQSIFSQSLYLLLTIA